jgi:hypothetical protein
MKKRSPLLTDSPIDHLDHLERCALTDADGNASGSQLRSDLIITGSGDALETEDAVAQVVSDHIEAAIDAAFTEAEYRITACTPRYYPFSLQRKVLLNRDHRLSFVYTFLLGLSLFGEGAVDQANGAKLFEEVCSCASRAYFGSRLAPAENHIFGFPRRIGAKDFVSAVEELCLCKLREGAPDKKFPTAHTMKDAGLDIVTWRSFPDQRTSKLIAFGQCATGKNWWGKRHELQPGDWCRTWMSKTPHVIPIKMFFVPHAIAADEWAELGYQAGIIFDRFRIAHFAEQNISRLLRKEIKAWNKIAFSTERSVRNC